MQGKSAWYYLSVCKQCLKASKWTYRRSLVLSLLKTKVKDIYSKGMLFAKIIESKWIYQPHKIIFEQRLVTVKVIYFNLIMHTVFIKTRFQTTPKYYQILKSLFVQNLALYLPKIRQWSKILTEITALHCTHIIQHL